MIGKKSRKRKLKLLCVFPHYNLPSYGGSLRSSQIGKFFGRRGHEVTVLCPAVHLRKLKRFPEAKGKLFSEVTMEGDVRVIRVFSLENFRRSWRHRFLYEVILAGLALLRGIFLPRPDMVIAAYPPAVAPLSGMLLAKLKNTKLIYEVRDLMAAELRATKYVSDEKFVKRAEGMEMLMANQAHHIIAVSQGIKQHFVDRGVAPEKITVIANGYESDLFAQMDDSIDPRKEFNWGDRFVVVYAGALTQAYDLPTLLKAAELLRDDREVLVSIIGEGERKAEYQKFCESRGLNNVQFVGLQPRERMPAILSRADLGVHMFNSDPIWAYVLGNKTFDYLGSGLPMVYAGIGDTAQLLIDSKGGVVIEPGDHEAMARTIRELKADPERLRMMSRQGQRYVIDNYTRDNLLLDMERMLLDIKYSRL